MVASIAATRNYRSLGASRGKSGGQRGTSRREDLLDTAIVLEHPSDYAASEGLRCVVRYEKNRGFDGEDARLGHLRCECTWKAKGGAGRAAVGLFHCPGVPFIGFGTARQPSRHAKAGITYDKGFIGKHRMSHLRFAVVHRNLIRRRGRGEGYALY